MFLLRFGHMLIRVVYGIEVSIPAFLSAHTCSSEINYTRLATDPVFLIRCKEYDGQSQEMEENCRF